MKIQTLHQFKKMENRLKQVNEVFLAFDCVGVLLFEDNVERDSYAWINVAARHTKPSFVYTYSYASNNEFAETYRDSKDHQIEGRRKKVLSLFYKSWWLKYRGRSYFRLPVPQIIAYETFGLSPVNPLVVNAGHADVIFLESQFQKEEFEKYEGTRHLNFKIIGSPVFDDLYREKQRWASKKEKTLVVAIPPNQYPQKTSPFFKNFEELVAFWIKASRELNGFDKVIYNPHPNLSRHYFEDFPLKENESIHFGRVAEILPQADLYLSSVSSTIKWACALEVPSIDFDVYGYDYLAYKNRKSIKWIATPDELLAYIQLINQKQIANQTEESGFWGCVDGKFAERFVKNLTSHR